MHGLRVLLETNTTRRAEPTLWGESPFLGLLVSRRTLPSGGSDGLVEKNSRKPAGDEGTPRGTAVFREKMAGSFLLR